MTTSPSRRLRLPTQPLLRHLVFALCGAAVLYVLTTKLSAYYDSEVGEVALFVIALAGLSVLTGMNGQISLGHGAFMAVGAYTLALLMTHTQWNFVLELLAAVGTAAVMGLVIGIPATRLKGPYLAGMTLLFAVSLPQIVTKWPNTFGGDAGVPTTVPNAPGTVNPEEWLAWIEILGALVVLVLLANLMQSRYGRSFRAVRDDEIAASLSGIHVARTKVLAFVVSAGCAGLAGAFFALSKFTANPGAFTPTLSIQLLAAMVLSGTGSLVGMWSGAILLVFSLQWSTSLADHFNLGTGVSAYLATIFFGLVLIVAMIAAPNGIQGGVRWVWREIRGMVGGSTDGGVGSSATGGPPATDATPLPLLANE
jgi:branched-chain amino acid transport system permease protein